MAGKGLWNSIKEFGGAVSANSMRSNYIDRAVRWGAIGGAIGGASEWAQGGSFFEGVKSGALTGAVAGAGYTAYKAGRAGPPKFTTPGGIGSAEAFSKATRQTAHEQAVAWRQRKAAARSATGAGAGQVSKQVEALATNSANINTAQNVMGGTMNRWTGRGGTWNRRRQWR